MKQMSHKMKNSLTLLVIAVLIPCIVLGGMVLFEGKFYTWTSLCIAILSCVPFLYLFEQKDTSANELIVLAVLVAVAVAGRFLFALIPGFKPVTAMVILVAIYFGKEAGFVVGSLAAVVSNFYFGQGPWTPFQMFAWGFVGFLAGVLTGLLRRHKACLLLYGAIAGVLFSVIVDINTAMWIDGTFRLSRFVAACISALPFTIEYALSNVLFLLILAKPIGDILQRMKKKYGLFAGVK